MSNDNGKSPVVTSSPTLKDGERVIPVTLKKEQEALIVNEAVITLLDKFFEIQDAFDNQTKFNTKILLDCVRAGLRAECSRLIAAWDSAINKQSKLTPKNNRDENVALLLESRKGQQAKAMVDLATSIKRSMETGEDLTKL